MCLFKYRNVRRTSLEYIQFVQCNRNCMRMFVEANGNEFTFN